MSLSPGTRIRDAHNPGRLGIITNSAPRERPSGRQWQIRWDNAGVSYEYEGSLEPVDSEVYQDPYQLVHDGKFARIDDLRRNLTFVHLTGRLANLVYSMGVTNTDFYPHQYRPLLTLLESPSSGILIADEVGLGKTIEAGLIWTEYRARYDKRRLLVVCPAMLREKWRDELELRFGVTAHIVGSKELLDGLRKHPAGSGPEAAWIISYQSARPPRAWAPQTKSKDNHSSAWELADFLYQNTDEHNLLDMVVFDEAHYMRNRDTGAWHLGELLRNVSDYQVMLSATPINLKSDDLFSLLTLLDSDHFSSPDDLSRVIDSNRPLVVARDIALNLRKTAAEFSTALQAIRLDSLLANSAQLRRLIDFAPTEEQFQDRRYRSEVAETLERVNLLSHVLTRTRKRDIHERRIERRVYRESVPMSDAERQFYTAVTAAIRQYAIDRDINDGFLLATPQRQVSSCPAALLRVWRDGLAEDEDLGADPSYELAPETVRRDGLGPLRSFLQATVPHQIKLDDLEKNDTKFGRLIELLGKLFATNPSEKVILFTAFRATARYVAERLNAIQMPATIVWGGPQNKPKHVVIQEFRDDGAMRVLVSTEVAAEGVDLQFCRTVINYDMPWNPTRVEQRIGRVDRLGQTAEYIYVWNLYFADTIDERIVTRLLDRLKIFEESLGETEAIVGETVTRLEYELLCRPRSPDEENALIDRAALALEVVARQRRELEENAPHMMAHGQRVLERIAAAQQLSRYVTESDLYTFVRDSLARYWPGHEFTADDPDSMQVKLRISPDLAAQWEPYLRDRSALGQTRLATGRLQRVVFRNNVTERYGSEGEVIHQFHPLVGFFASDLKRREEQFFPIVAVRLAAGDATAGIVPGIYGFAVVHWSFSGVQQEEWLVSAVSPADGGPALDEETSDLILQAARLRGRDWLGARHEIDTAALARAVETSETSIALRYQDAAARKRAENEDRARFQLDSVERHEVRRVITLSDVEEGHRQRGRDSLVKATQGQLRIFRERMQTRRAAVRARQQMTTTKQFVCGGVINVTMEGQ